MSINCFLFTIVLLNVGNPSTVGSGHFSTWNFFLVYDPFHVYRFRFLINVISCRGSVISKIGVIV